MIKFFGEMVQFKNRCDFGNFTRFVFILYSYDATNLIYTLVGWGQSNKRISIFIKSALVA